MNLETVLMCAQTTANQHAALLGGVSPEITALIEEVESLLAPDPMVEEAPAKTSKK